MYTVGADITLTPALVATTRYGYWAYTGTPMSRGVPTGLRYIYRDTNYPYTAGNAPALAGTKALDGTVLPTQFVNSAGYSNIGDNTQTAFDWWRRHTFSQDLAYFKNAWGTHNFKFGYGFQHGTADEFSGIYNTADVYVAYNVQYVPNSQIGIANCAAIVAQNQAKYGVPGGNADGTGCQGNYGTVNIRDLISASGKVGSWNHSFYVQDAWTISKRLTLNLGLRLDKENLPSYNTLPGFQGINFGWGQKVAPRLGAAYDVLGNGRLKVYGSFGYFFDIMKYQLPQGSFGGAYWHDCVYALDSPDYTQIIPQRDAQGHYCPLGGGNTPAVGSIPNARFIENYDYREPANDPNQIGSLGRTGLVDPNLKPMKQHVWTFGGGVADLARPGLRAALYPLAPRPHDRRLRRDHSGRRGLLHRQSRIRRELSRAELQWLSGEPEGRPQLRWRRVAPDQAVFGHLVRLAVLHLQPPVRQLHRPDRDRHQRWRRGTQRRQHRPRVRRAVHVVRCARQGRSTGRCRPIGRTP